ncbi:MAG TPA: TonB-dependent receptor plug domain-containing protein, partial [Methylophilaceae bacterium]|nr:TonB-dependent receptor plug domain-containing protein [Methylophilaceae bacterium]
MMAAPYNAVAADAAAAKAKTETLGEVEVSATSTKETKATKGYLGKRSTTATKTDTELRDVPQSISVVTQDQIKDQAVRSIEDAIRYTPGVGMAQGEGNRDAVVFRGNQSTSDFFIDGVRDDVQYYRDLYNMDRVEVLKGPSGMIFGRGGAGGVINRVTKEATWDPIRELTLQGGSYDQRRAAIDVGQAINEVAAFRLNAMVEDA